MTDAIIEQVRIRLDWGNAQQAQPLHANQAIAQVGSPGSDGTPDGVYITLGNAPVPVLLEGDEANREAIIEELATAGVKVNILGQFHISRQLLADIISVLQTTAAKYDAAAQQGRQDRSQEPGADR